MSDDARSAALIRVIEAIDEANARDPEVIAVDGGTTTAALLYGRRMSDRLQAFSPSAGLELQVAARGQHIERWKIPRRSYPEGRIGYLTWRKDLQRFHADRLGEIIADAGLDRAVADRVGQLVRKQGIATDPEVQTLEDVACLVFVANYLDPFAAGHSDDKLADILAKTWRKMSPRAQDAARAMGLPQHNLDLLAIGLTRSI